MDKWSYRFFYGRTKHQGTNSSTFDPSLLRTQQLNPKLATKSAKQRGLRMHEEMSVKKWTREGEKCIYHYRVHMLFSLFWAWASFSCLGVRSHVCHPFLVPSSIESYCNKISFLCGCPRITGRHLCLGNKGFPASYLKGLNAILQSMNFGCFYENRVFSLFKLFKSLCELIRIFHRLCSIPP